MRESFSFIRRVSQIGTLLKTKFLGVHVGEDSFGNHYYQSRHFSKDNRPERWVWYAGTPEPTKVPPEWFAWLHHICDTPLPILCDQPLPNVVSKRYVWQKPHNPNLTGSHAAYLPDGYGLNHLIKERRHKSTPTYGAWCPPES